MEKDPKREWRPKMSWPEMERGKVKVKKDICEFGIVNKACYFCGQPRTIRHSEHYTFCPNCSAIYSKMILQESHCKHFDGDQAIVIELEPCYPEYRDKLYVDKGDICSICGANVDADGW